MTCFFFDLDGTLTDSEPGLLASFQAGLLAAGGPAMTQDALRPFLGTPLPVMFKATMPGIDATGIATGIAGFRKHFETAGIKVNRLYPGVRAMLQRLHRHNNPAWIVTSKPGPQAIRVAALLGIDTLVAGVVGASLAETDTKTDLVARALDLSGAAPHSTIMLGDRHYDVEGALANSVRPVGALWGYGSRAELEAAGCHEFAASAASFSSRFVAPNVLAIAAE